MPRYSYTGLLIVVVGVVGVFLYKTNAPVEQTAEFGGVSLRIEYATTSEARDRGLGGRTEIPEDYGMLFVFPKDDKYGFWMKDMLVPIDVFWLNSKGQVVSIASDVAISTYPNVLYPTEPARFVLETVAGFAREYNIATGTPLRLKNVEHVSQ